MIRAERNGFERSVSDSSAVWHVLRSPGSSSVQRVRGGEGRSEADDRGDSRQRAALGRAEDGALPIRTASLRRVTDGGSLAQAASTLRRGREGHDLPNTAARERDIARASWSVHRERGASGGPPSAPSSAPRAGAAAPSCAGIRQWRRVDGAMRPRAIWLQQRIRDDACAERLAEAGITVVQDRCLMVRLRLRAALWRTPPA